MTQPNRRDDLAFPEAHTAGTPVPTSDWAERGLRIGSDGMIRCGWAGDDPSYQAYHDQEWGRPVTDRITVYEKLCLEGFQSGLAWITILRKRERFREVFAGFDPQIVSRYDESDIERLLDDAGIIRHRGKITATIHNAAALLAMEAAGEDLVALLWHHRPDPAPRRQRLDEIPAQTPESAALSKALKTRGFRFVGPTTAYAAMQALGVVNDHSDACWVYDACEQARADTVAAFDRRGG